MKDAQIDWHQHRSRGRFRQARDHGRRVRRRGTDPAAGHPKTLISVDAASMSNLDEIRKHLVGTHR